MTAEELLHHVSADKELIRIRKKITSGKATFSDTAAYSERASDLIGNRLSDLIPDLPSGSRESLCTDILHGQYEDMNEILAAVQKALDEVQGLHLAPQKASFPSERVQQVAHSLEDDTVPVETIQRRAGSAVTTVAKSFHDDYMKENAKFRNKAGLKCFLNRQSHGKCCDWCSAIVGRYAYSDHPLDIFRRHDNCSCTVTFENGRQRQDVWSKRTWEVPEKDAGADDPTRFTDENRPTGFLPKKLTGDKKDGIIGVKGSPMTIEEAVKGANPNYSTDRQCQINCQRCVQAYEMRRRGYDVEALPKPKGRSIIGWGNECFIDDVTVKKQKGNLLFEMKQKHSDIVDKLTSSPEGSRYVIYAQWKTGSAHVFIAEVENGVVRYIDPQSGNMDCSSYFSQAIDGKFGIFRIDDKHLTSNTRTLEKTVKRSD